MQKPMPLDGLLLVDKPAGLTSHDVVDRVRKILNQKSVGHTGTLDPLATGLLVLVLGDATKLSDYLMMADKAYRMTVRLGVTTDTLDRTGQVLSRTSGVVPTAQLTEAVQSLAGDFSWPVPLYSAAKVDGKKLYEYGRAGQVVDLPMKEMSFWDVQLEDHREDLVQVSLQCSKGSFVRTWAAELGRLLGVGGMIEELRRLRVGRFSVDQAVNLDDLEARTMPLTPAAFGEALVPMARALPAWKALVAGPRDARLVANGQVPRDLGNRLIFEQKQAEAQGEPIFVKVIGDEGDLLAIMAAEPGQGLKIRRVFSNRFARPFG